MNFLKSDHIKRVSAFECFKWFVRITESQNENSAGIGATVLLGKKSKLNYRIFFRLSSNSFLYAWGESKINVSLISPRESKYF